MGGALPIRGPSAPGGQGQQGVAAGIQVQGLHWQQGLNRAPGVPIGGQLVVAKAPSVSTQV